MQPTPMTILRRPAPPVPVGTVVVRVVGAPLFVIGVVLTIMIDRLGRRLDPAVDWEPAPVDAGGRLWSND